MIGLVDETLLFALRRAWRVVVSDIQAWRRLFPDYLEREQRRVDDWHRALTHSERSSVPSEKCVAFGLAELQRQAPEHPGIFTRLSHARTSIDPSGMVGAGQGEEDGYLALEQSVEVVVIATSKQLAAALATFCLAAIFASLRPILMRSHIVGLSFREASEIGPMRELLPERSGAYWYRLRYVATTEMAMTSFGSELLALPFSIHDVFATDEFGKPGHVVTASKEAD